jgi:hypothetical protein
MLLAMRVVQCNNDEKDKEMKRTPISGVDVT